MGTKLMDANELSIYLGISRNAVYTLLHSASFPTVKIGNRLFAVREEVDIWVHQQAKKGGYHYGEKTR